MIDKNQFLRKDKKDKKFFRACNEITYSFQIRKLCKDTKFVVRKFGS